MPFIVYDIGVIQPGIAALTGQLIRTPQAAMDAITAAVTPVVMISANAILISGISAKHQATSDRVRALAGEWRLEGTTGARRETIQAEIRLFRTRLRWIAAAHMLLYVSTGSFVATVIIIAVTSLLSRWSHVAFPLLVCGVLMTLIALLFEVIELKHGRETIAIEIRDVMPGEAGR